MSGLMIALVLFTLTGGAVAVMAGIRLAGTGSERVAELYVLGLGSVGTLLFLAALAHLPITRVTVVLLIVLASVVLAARRSPARALLESDGSKGGGILPTALLLVPLIAVALSVLYVPLHDYDGRVFWLLKAKAIATEHAVEGPFFHGQGAYDPRNQYPLLVPLDAAAIFSLTGSLDERRVQGMYALTAAALLFILRNRLTRRFGSKSGAWLAALAAWLPQLSSRPEGSAISAYSDLPLAAFSACAFFTVLETPESERRRLFPLSVAFLVLTKNEGLLIGLILTAASVVRWRRRSAGGIAALAGSAAALWLWRSGIPLGDEENLPRLLLHLPSRIGQEFVPSTIAFGGAALDPAVWGLFWPAVVLAAILVGLRQREGWVALLLLAGMVAVYDCIYMVTTWRMTDLVVTSADRLLLPLIGPALFILAAGAETLFGPERRTGRPA